ncbi:Hypothetical protein A7982_07441 [Minicystis rosea]|nr:Hypothetical protein A7982_07441 [Minicystis rosea]
MNDIRSVVRHFILTQCLAGASPDDLRDHMSLRTSGILDSMTTLKLVGAIETAAGIELEADDLSDENFDSVARIVSFVERRRAGG